MSPAEPPDPEEDATPPEWSPEERLLDAIVDRAFAGRRDRDAPGRPPSAADLRHFVGPGNGLPAERQAPARWLQAGDRLGPYLIRRELGRGGFGVVYLARDTQLRRRVALKVPRPDLVQNAALWDQLAREARIAAGLEHPGIVPVHDAGILDGTFHIASVYERADDLAAWLTRHPRGLPFRAAAELALQLADALAHAHARGTLHRDLKPGNVLVIDPEESDEDSTPGAGSSRHAPRAVAGEGDAPDDRAPLTDGTRSVPATSVPRLKITDFGLGKLLESIPDTATLSGYWQGTPPYMAPEQLVLGLGPVGAAADVYALGAILYELLTGRPTYPDRSIPDLYGIHERRDPPAAPRRLRPGCPADLETIALACLEHDPAKRPTAARVVENLRAHLDHRPIDLRPLPWHARAHRHVRRRPYQSALIAVTAAGLAGLTGLTIRLIEITAVQGRTIQQLEASRQTEHRALYDSALLLASVSLDSGSPEFAQATLLANKPAPGDAPPDFAYRLLWRRATRTHTVAPLLDLRWWDPTGATGALLPDRPDGLNLLTSIQSIGPRRIELFNGEVNARIGPDSRVIRHSIPGQRLRSLRLVSHGRAVEVAELPAAPFRLSPDGSTLALASLPALAPTTDPPIELGSVQLPWPGPDPRRPDVEMVRLLRIPSATWIEFSADGMTLGALAYTDPTAEQSDVFPVFYRPADDLRIGHPDRLRSYEAEWRGDELPHPILHQLTKLSLSPDGRLAAITDRQPRVEVFEVDTGRRLWAHDAATFGPDAMCSNLNFSPDGRLLATGGTGGTIRVWDATNGDLLREFRAGTDTISALAFYPDGRTLASVVQNEDRIRLWRLDPEPAEPPALEHGESAEIWGLAFLEGGLLAACDDDHFIRIWNPANGSLIQGHQRPTGFMALAASADRRKTAAIDYDGRVFLLSATNAPPRLVADLGGKGRAVAWSPDGSKLVAAGKSADLLVLDARGQHRVPTPHPKVYALAWSPDGRTLATGGEIDRTVAFFDAPALTLRRQVELPGRVTCMAYSPDGKQLAVGDAEGRFYLLDPSNPDSPPTIVERASESGGVWALAFSPDGRTLATGGDDHLVRLWEPVTARELARLKGHTAKVHALAFDPAGNTLATADFVGKILIWHADPGTQHN